MDINLIDKKDKITNESYSMNKKELFLAENI